MINLLGLCNLVESVAPIRRYALYGNVKNDDLIPVQHNFFFSGNEVPGRVPIIFYSAFTIVFVVYVDVGYDSPIVHHYYMSQIRVTNKSKGLKGTYFPSHHGIPGEGEDVIWLSHWKLEDDQSQDGAIVGGGGIAMKDRGDIGGCGLTLRDGVTVEESPGHGRGAMMSVSGLGCEVELVPSSDRGPVR
ncbi:hypothetical protein L3X38_012822 [Prunus dulcis]|uniref:Uncharacterized protein n=1 Tax=Prunus dulcis TaxID=3755 RepID=A0AAD4WK23_PRUDU|nr:hypothetical protein L3X38_012822 [Prunus dulcis]